MEIPTSKFNIQHSIFNINFVSWRLKPVPWSLFLEPCAFEIMDDFIPTRFQDEIALSG
jgi:hypothetical protein